MFIFPTMRSNSASSLLLAALMMLSPGLMAHAHAADDPQKSLATTREQIQQLNERISTGKSQREAAAHALQVSEQRLAAARKALRTTQAQISKKRQALQALQNRQLAHRKQLGQLRDQLAKQIRAAFVLGHEPGHPAKLLQDTTGNEAAGRLLAYHAYWQKAQAQVLEKTRTEVAALNDVEQQLLAEQAELDALLAEHRKAVEIQRTAQAERSEKLKQVEQGLRDQQKSLEKLRADEAALQALIRELQQAQAAREKAQREQAQQSGGPSKPQRYYDQAFKSLKGKLPWPLAGTLLAHFGQPKGGGALKWNGHWIAAPAGTPVKAVARGEVVHVGWLHRYGLIVLLEHEGGYFSLYGHLADTEVSIGDQVKAGQTLATAGDSGGNTQTGAYFELRKGTEPIDPARWLVKP